ncbi:hypothetical protein GBA52_003586 [Prunus armeniaca]|nr:hypothetical protein GBA52_003586 [Prunus armeniaca]
MSGSKTPPPQAVTPLLRARKRPTRLRSLLTSIQDPQPPVRLVYTGGCPGSPDTYSCYLYRVGQDPLSPIFRFRAILKGSYADFQVEVKP